MVGGVQVILLLRSRCHAAHGPTVAHRLQGNHQSTLSPREEVGRCKDSSVARTKQESELNDEREMCVG